MEDFLDRISNWKTTIVGLAAAIIAVLVGFGVLGPDNEGVELVTNGWDIVVEILAGISGLILLFSKDK